MAGAACDGEILKTLPADITSTTTSPVPGGLAGYYLWDLGALYEEEWLDRVKQELQLVALCGQDPGKDGEADG